MRCAEILKSRECLCAWIIHNFQGHPSMSYRTLWYVSFLSLSMMTSHERHYLSDCLTACSGQQQKYLSCALLYRVIGLCEGIHIIKLKFLRLLHDDVIKWKHFPCYWTFVRGIHLSPVNSHHRGQWRGALMFSLVCAWIIRWVNNPNAGDLRRHDAHCDITVMNDLRYIWCTGVVINLEKTNGMAIGQWQLTRYNYIWGCLTTLARALIASSWHLTF